MARGGRQRTATALFRQFSPDQLSMIASHLAGGGVFCCKEGAAARRNVTCSKTLRARLADHAYESWGCGGNSPQWVARYLEKFLALV